MFSSSDMASPPCSRARYMGSLCGVSPAEFQSWPRRLTRARGDSHSRRHAIHPHRGLADRQAVPELRRQGKRAAPGAAGRHRGHRPPGRGRRALPMCWWRATSMTMRPPPRRRCWNRWSACGAFPRVDWHVIPGNHDYHRGNGLWDRAAAPGLPPNVAPPPHAGTRGAGRRCRAVPRPAPPPERGERPHRLDGRRRERRGPDPHRPRPWLRQRLRFTRWRGQQSHRRRPREARRPRLPGTGRLAPHHAGRTPPPGMPERPRPTASTARRWARCCWSTSRDRVPRRR